MTVRPVWVIQEGVSEQRALMSACQAQGLEARVLALPATSDTLPPITQAQPVLFYGSARLSALAARQPGWTPGAYWDPTQHTISAMMQHYAGLTLNADALIMPLAEVAAQRGAGGEELFIRPDDARRGFVGAVMSRDALRRWVKQLDASAPPGPVSGRTPVAVSAVRAIAQEWRLFIINNRVIASSQYREWGMPKLVSGAPVAVSVFAQGAAQRWSPSVAFSMDIAREVSGRISIIDCDIINSSALYASDVAAFVSQLSALASQRWPAR